MEKKQKSRCSEVKICELYSRMMRKVCVEPVFFNEDGSIDEVEMTSQGAGPPLPATGELDAARACLLFGNVRIQLAEEGNEELGEIMNKDRVAFKYLNFEEGVDSVAVRVAPREAGGKIVFSTEMPWTAPFATIDVPSADSIENVARITFGVKLSRKVTGEKALWLRFYGDEEKILFDVDWIRFYHKEEEQDISQSQPAG